MYKFIEKERVIIQLQSSLTEREQQLQSSLAENAQLQSYSTKKKTRLQISVSEKEWTISQLRRSFSILHSLSPRTSDQSGFIYLNA